VGAFANTLPIVISSFFFLGTEKETKTVEVIVEPAEKFLGGPLMMSQHDKLRKIHRVTEPLFCLFPVQTGFHSLSYAVVIMHIVYWD
jgi:hypothetical protein